MILTLLFDVRKLFHKLFVLVLIWPQYTEQILISTIRDGGNLNTDEGYRGTIPDGIMEDIEMKNEMKNEQAVSPVIALS